MTKTRRLIGMIVSLLIGGIFLYLAFRKVGFSKFWGNVVSANYWWLLPYISLIVVSAFFRTLRWHLLLQPLGKAPFWRSFHITNVGTMALNLLPMRLGEFFRPYLISDRFFKESSDIKMSAALATVVVERMMDLLVVIAFFFIGVAMVGNIHPLLKPLTWLGPLAFLGAAGLLTATWIMRERLLSLLTRLGHKVHRGLTDKVVGLLRTFLTGISTLPDLRSFLLFNLYSAGHWGASALSFWVMFRAFGFERLGVLESAGVMGILGLGLMIPTAPAFAGSFEKFNSLGITLMDSRITQDAAVACTAVLHVSNLIIIVGLGLLSLYLGGLSFTKVVRESTQATPDDLETQPEDRGRAVGNGGA